MRFPAKRPIFLAIAAIVLLTAVPLVASSAGDATPTVGTMTAAVSWHEPPRLIGLEGGWTVELDPEAWTEARRPVGDVVTVLGWIDQSSPRVVRSAQIRDGLFLTADSSLRPDEVKSGGDDDDDHDGDGDDDDGDGDGDDDDGDDDDGGGDDDGGDDDGDDDDGDGDPAPGVVFDLEGRLESTTPPASFRVEDGRSYRVTTVTRYGGGLTNFDDLIPGQILRVRARRLSNDDYVADRVDLRGTGSLVDVEGSVVLVGADHLVIDNVGSVAATATTVFDGDADRLSDLQPGWVVLARVFLDQTGGWQAVRVRAQSAEVPSVDDEEFQSHQALVIPASGIDRQSLADRHDAAIVGEVSDFAMLLSWQYELTNEVLNALAADPDVRGVEPNYYFRDPESVRRRFPVVDRAANGDTVLTQPAAAVTQLGKALERATGTNTVVALLDTGVDPNHPLLQGAIVPGGMDLVDGDFEPWETEDGIDQDGDGDIDESSGHGTFVASLVATGAPDAVILPYRVLDDDGGGTAYGLAVALADAIKNRVDIINLSLVYRSRSDAVDLLLEQAAAAGIVVVCSAGNDGTDTLPFPAADRHVIAVTALTADGAAPADFANLAEQVMLGVPGEDIFGALPPDLFGSASGTSMAAPFVTAAAALLLDVDPALSPELVRLTLEQSGSVITTQNWDGVLLQMNAAVRLLEPVRQVTVVPSTGAR